MGSTYRLSIRDDSKEIGKTEVNTVPLTAANLVAQTTLSVAFRDAVQDVVKGVLASDALQIASILSNVKPNDPEAQRGIKWTLQGEDTTTHELFQNFVPTADIGQLDSGDEELDLTAGNGLALKAAYDAFVRSPGDHAASLIRCYYSD